MRMARTAALGLAFAVAVAPAGYAQKAKAGGMLIGPWAGLNFATFSATNLTGITFSSRTALTVGGELERTLSPDLFLRVGAFYSMRGSSADVGGTSGTVKLNYIEIPVMLGYRFAMQGSRVSPYVMAGGQFGIKAGCTVESAGTSLDCNNPNALGADVTSTDIGITFGGGVGFPAGSGTIKVDARYLISFTNLISAATTSSTLKNVGFTIAAGYMFPIGR
jgi:opacity protein-like surface antigen